MEKTKEVEQERLIDEILTRGVGIFVDPDGMFRKKLTAKIKGEYPMDIVVKFGVDPTRPDIHLGHAVVLRKLRQLQDIGCKVVFLIGDFTALIGDPTGKSRTRPQLESNKEEQGSSSEGEKGLLKKEKADNEQWGAVKRQHKKELDKSEQLLVETEVSDKLPSSEEVETNMKTYLEQAGKILDTSKERFSWIKNSDWYTDVSDLVPGNNAHATITITNNETGAKNDIAINPRSLLGKAILYESSRMQIQETQKKEITQVTLRGFMWTTKHVTVAQLLERDMFQVRLREEANSRRHSLGETIFIHEMLYPVLQGTDSFALAKIYGDCSLEIGGSDQMYNMMMGRKIMSINNRDPQAVLSLEILVGTDGKEKMSKSLDNYVGITDEPKMMFGKIMSIPDGTILSYFELCTFTPMEEIEGIKKKLAGGKVNPRDLKMDLAQQIVEIYHGEAKAKEARMQFINTFQKKLLPADIQEAKTDKGTPLVNVLLDARLVDSKVEFRRLVADGAIKKDGREKISNPAFVVQADMVLKVGKHRFVKIVVA